MELILNPKSQIKMCTEWSENAVCTRKIKYLTEDNSRG